MFTDEIIKAWVDTTMFSICLESFACRRWSPVLAAAGPSLQGLAQGFYIHICKQVANRVGQPTGGGWAVCLRPVATNLPLRSFPLVFKIHPYWLSSSNAPTWHYFAKEYLS